MRGQGPSEKGAGQLPMEGMGGRGGGGQLSSLSPLALLKHLPACLTQEVLKKEGEKRQKEEINKRERPTEMHWRSREKLRGKSSSMERRPGEETEVKGERKQ